MNPVSDPFPVPAQFQPEAKPLYLQIKELLIQRVVKGEWGPGEMLPSELRLAAEYRVHQGTVRKALEEMAARSLVVRQQGKGTFVAAAELRHNPYHFLRIRPKDNIPQRPATQFLSIERAMATPTEREMLSMGPDSLEVVRAEKLRRFDGKAVIVERVVYPADLFPGLDELLGEMRPETTYGLLEEKYRVLIVQVSERVSAIPASLLDAQRLDTQEGTPLLRVERVAFAVSGRPAEWRVSHCLTDAYEYFVELH